MASCGWKTLTALRDLLRGRKKKKKKAHKASYLCDGGGGGKRWEQSKSRPTAFLMLVKTNSLSHSARGHLEHLCQHWLGFCVDISVCLSGTSNFGRLRPTEICELKQNNVLNKKDKLCLKICEYMLGRRYLKTPINPPQSRFLGSALQLTMK